MKRLGLKRSVSLRALRMLALALMVAGQPGVTFAEGKGSLNYSTAAAVARACYEHIDGKNPTVTLSKVGFSAGSKNIRGERNYNMKIREGLFFATVRVTPGHKSGKNRCGVGTMRTNVSEQKSLLLAFRKELSSRGNKQTFRKNALGGTWEIWVGPIGSYELNAPEP